MTEKQIYKFADLKKDIKEVLKKRSELIGISESVTLVDGFITEPFKMELSGAFTVGGPTIPLIMLVGDKSGRVYFFALRALLPELKL